MWDIIRYKIYWDLNVKLTTRHWSIYHTGTATFGLYEFCCINETEHLASFGTYFILRVYTESVQIEQLYDDVILPQLPESLILLFSCVN